MKLKEFKTIRNRQKPDMCYMFELVKNGFRYRIFTMNSGFSYLATIEEPTPTKSMPHCHTTIFKANVDFEFEAIKQFKNFKKQE